MAQPGFIDDDLAKFGELTSVELFNAVAQNLNYLIDSSAPGTIIPIMIDFPGTPTPNPALWQACEGGFVTDSLSPLVGQAVPDMRDKYLKGAASLGQSGQTGGSNSIDLTHNHTGFTDLDGVDPSVVESGGNFPENKDHTHSIPSALGVTDLNPAHFKVKHFLKIR